LPVVETHLLTLELHQIDLGATIDVIDGFAEPAILQLEMRDALAVVVADHIDQLSGENVVADTREDQPGIEVFVFLAPALEDFIVAADEVEVRLGTDAGAPALAGA